MRFIIEILYKMKCITHKGRIRESWSAWVVAKVILVLKEFDSYSKFPYKLPENIKPIKNIYIQFEENINIIHHMKIC